MTRWAVVEVDIEFVETQGIKGRNSTEPEGGIDKHFVLRYIPLKIHHCSLARDTEI